jgi:hypothetical protein
MASPGIPGASAATLELLPGSSSRLPDPVDLNGSTAKEYLNTPHGLALFLGPAYRAGQPHDPVTGRDVVQPAFPGEFLGKGPPGLGHSLTVGERE